MVQLFAKALGLPVLHALTVCDTTSFFAGHGISKILDMAFVIFFLIERMHCFIKIIKKKMRVTALFLQ